MGGKEAGGASSYTGSPLGTGLATASQPPKPSWSWKCGAGKCQTQLWSIPQLFPVVRGEHPIPGPHSPSSPGRLGRSGWGQGINRGKGQPCACPPPPTLLLLGDKTFNYRYLVPLIILNVLIASSPRTSFHGKIIAKSQGGKGENPHPCGFPAKETE